MSYGYAYGGVAALELAGGYFASQNIKDTAKLNRDIGEMNAEFAELDAYDAKIKGETIKAQYQKTIDQTISDQRAILAAQDIDASYGSIGEIEKETRFIADINKMEIDKQAEEEALGYTREARGIRLNSFLSYSQAQRKASSVMFQSGVGAAKTGLSGYGRG